MEYSQEKRGGLNHVRFADEELIKTQVLHGEAAQTIIQGENCSVYKIENETGEGVITRYPVFPGIELLYDDIHMSCGVAHREDPRADLLEINHCRLGRFECEFSDGSAVYLGEGDLAVNVMTNRTRETWFQMCIRDRPSLYDCTVLISSHMLSEIELIADDIGILNHGRLLFEGSMNDLRQYALQSGFAADNLEDVFLSMVEKDNMDRKQRAKL